MRKIHSETKNQEKTGTKVRKLFFTLFSGFKVDCAILIKVNNGSLDVSDLLCSFKINGSTCFVIYNSWVNFVVIFVQLTLLCKTKAKSWYHRKSKNWKVIFRENILNFYKKNYALRLQKGSNDRLA